VVLGATLTLDHAKTLLDTSQDTLESIAGDSGFSVSPAFALSSKGFLE
jgi:transcriptional regulator GlxA family with amidase domain